MTKEEIRATVENIEEEISDVVLTVRDETDKDKNAKQEIISTLIDLVNAWWDWEPDPEVIELDEED